EQHESFPWYTLPSTDTASDLEPRSRDCHHYGRALVRRKTGNVPNNFPTAFVQLARNQEFGIRADWERTGEARPSDEGEVPGASPCPERMRSSPARRSFSTVRDN